MSRNHDQDIERFAEIFKALSNPNRLRIFMQLVQCCAPDDACGSSNQPKCVGTVGANLGISPSTVSHHIKELRQAGVIQVSRCGQSIKCWVDPEMLTDLCNFIHTTAGGSPCCSVDTDGKH